MKSNCTFLSRLNIPKHLGHFPSPLQWKHPERVRLAAQRAQSSTFLPRFLTLVFMLLLLAIQGTSEPAFQSFLSITPLPLPLLSQGNRGHLAVLEMMVSVLTAFDLNFFPIKMFDYFK